MWFHRYFNETILVLRGSLLSWHSAPSLRCLSQRICVDFFLGISGRDGDVFLCSLTDWAGRGRGGGGGVVKTAVVCEYDTPITYCDVVIKKRVNGFVC